jgi:hypothetical protein
MPASFLLLIVLLTTGLCRAQQPGQPISIKHLIKVQGYYIDTAGRKHSANFYFSHLWIEDKIVTEDSSGRIFYLTPDLSRDLTFYYGGDSNRCIVLRNGRAYSLQDAGGPYLIRHYTYFGLGRKRMDKVRAFYVKDGRPIMVAYKYRPLAYAFDDYPLLDSMTVQRDGVWRTEDLIVAEYNRWRADTSASKYRDTSALLRGIIDADTYYDRVGEMWKAYGLCLFTSVPGFVILGIYSNKKVLKVDKRVNPVWLTDSLYVKGYLTEAREIKNDADGMGGGSGFLLGPLGLFTTLLYSLNAPEGLAR